MRTRSENQISAKEKQKTLECFLFENGNYRIPKSSPRKFRENSGKIQIDRKKTDMQFRHLQPFVGGNIVRQLDLRFLSF